MYEDSQIGTGGERSNSLRFNNIARSQDNRVRTHETAQRLSVLALRQWEKALTGIVALPVAAAVSTAAVVLYGTSLLENTFGLLESSIADLGRRVSDEDAPARADIVARGNDGLSGTMSRPS